MLLYVVRHIRYTYSEFTRPGYFSAYECLHLNDGYTDGSLDPVDQVIGGLNYLRGAYFSPRDMHTHIYIYILANEGQIRLMPQACR